MMMVFLEKWTKTHNMGRLARTTSPHVISWSTIGETGNQHHGTLAETRPAVHRISLVQTRQCYLREALEYAIEARKCNGTTMAIFVKQSL
jgi:hypothetical protein